MPKLKYAGEKTISEDFFVLTVANTRQFGNNAFIAPDAVPNDGMLDIVMIKPFPKILFPDIYISSFHKKDEQIEIFYSHQNRKKGNHKH